MNITTNDFQALEFNGVDIDKLEFNGDVVWTKPASAHVYGAKWYKSTNTVGRTDDAFGFVDPNPYVNDGSHPGSSPFDSLYPWSEMTKINDNSTGAFVKIPKYWFKITNNSDYFMVQIADGPLPGYQVSPSHRIRWSGDTEKDYVYVARYHANANGISQSGVYPAHQITRANARTKAKSLGTGYCLMDYQLVQTIWMLYFVEFAHWNAQLKIGNGCGTSSSGTSRQYTGQSDSIPYHTGTIKSTRGTYGAGIQYRWIEDLWANVFDWVDCITFNSDKAYFFLDPFNCTDSYSDADFNITRPTTSNYITDWQVVTNDNTWEGLMFPETVANDNTKIGDAYIYGQYAVACAMGGKNGQQTPQFGLFYLDTNRTASDALALFGYRTQYIPAST